MKIFVTGLSHKKTAIRVRERLAFDREQTIKALTELKNRFADSEFVILSTCNRVEIYCATKRESGVTKSDIIKFLSQFHNIKAEEFQDNLFELDDAEAARHLLMVSSSLDSMVVGEDQIIGQVKESYRLAVAAKSTDKMLNRLFHSAFATGKEVFSKTSISKGRISVAGVAVELAKQLFANIKAAKVVVIGAGEMGELLIQHLQCSDCRDIIVINRTLEKGQSIANSYHIKAQSWESLEEQLAWCDIVIASAAGEEYLFTKESIEKIMKGRLKKPLLIIDIAVPRNFQPQVNEIDNVFLYSIDELAEAAEHNHRLRQDDINAGLEIIEKNVDAFIEWFYAKDLGPLIGRMKERFEQICRDELELFLAKTSQNAFCSQAIKSCEDSYCKKTAEEMVSRIANKIAHCVIKNVSAVAREQGAVEAARLVDDIVHQAEQISSEKTSEPAIKPLKQTGQILRLLFWETTIRCNLSCAHCRRLETNEAAVNDLTTADGKQLIEQLADVGRRQSFMPVLVFSGGEPLCRSDLFELIKYAKGFSIVPALATNGALIDESMGEKIKNSGIVRVAVSLDGATAQTHNKLRQHEGSFEKAIEGINNLRKKQVPFQINITLTKSNADELGDVYKLAETLGAAALHIFMLVPVGCGESLAETDMLSAAEYEQKLLEISRLDAMGKLEVKVTCGPHYERIKAEQGHVSRCSLLVARDTSQESRATNQPNRPVKGCLAGMGVLFVNHQGDVFPCGYLPIKCGNILQQPQRKPSQRLADIWYGSEDLAKMRNSDVLEGKCGICDYRKVCGGCRARAYATTGNYMAEEPYCQYVPPPIAL